MLQRNFGFVMLLMFSTAAGFSQKPVSLTLKQITRLDSIATRDVPPSAPGIATGIVQDGKIIYQKVAGFADFADSTLISESTRFNIASNGKQFTALAILILADEKRIRLSDDIRKYLPELYPKIKSQITIENLLTHTSGIRDVYDLWSLQGITWWRQSYANKDALDLLGRQQELNFTPGSRYLYSNSNYILLATIVEKVSGKSFVAFTNIVFEKLNMPNTSFEDDHTKVRGPIARAYFNFGSWTTYDWNWNLYGDGNIFSTLSDQLRWEQILQNPPGSRIKMEVIQKSQQLTNAALNKNYGFGLEHGSYRGLPYKFHEGASGAWKSTVIRFPKKQVSFVTLTNTGKVTPTSQTRQMADVFFDFNNSGSEFLTKPVREGAFVSEAEITGVYQNQDGFTFQFEKQDSVLMLKRSGRNDVKLEREAGNIFHQTFDPDFKQEFLKNAKGEMTVTAYYTAHAPYTLTRPSADWGKVDFGRSEGEYSNAETNVRMTVRYRSGRTYFVKIGSQDSTIGTLVTPERMIVDNYVLDFNLATGNLQEVFLSVDRIARIRFRKLD